jgi:RHS repeat-associated protein
VAGGGRREQRSAPSGAFTVKNAPVRRDFFWDGDDRLRQVKQGAASRFQATYDGDGLRVTKTDLFSATYTYSRGPGGVLYDGATTYTPGLGHRYTGINPRFYHSDWVGSTRYLSDSSGNFFPSALRYDAFGNRTALAGPNQPTPFQFAGGWGYEAEYSDSTEPYLGLSYLEQRYYEPATGRFISRDPIGFAGGLNLYGYCGNNPVNAVDPSGSDPVVLPTLVAEGGAALESGIVAIGGALQQAGAALASTGAAAVAGLKTALQGVATSHGQSGPISTSCPAVSGGGANLSPIGGLAGANGGGVDLSPIGGAASASGGGADLSPIGGSAVASGGGADLRPTGGLAGANSGGADLSPTGGVSRTTGRGGENGAARRGREAHERFKEKVKARGWASEPRIYDPVTGRYFVPDAVTRRGRPIDLKPNTPSGRRAGRRQIRIYEGLTGKRGRVLYYDP